MPAPPRIQLPIAPAPGLPILPLAPLPIHPHPSPPQARPKAPRAQAKRRVGPRLAPRPRSSKQSRSRRRRVVLAPARLTRALSRLIAICERAAATLERLEQALSAAGGAASVGPGSAAGVGATSTRQIEIDELTARRAEKLRRARASGSDLLERAEAAAFVRRSPNAFDKHVRRHLPSYDVAGGKLWRRRDLEIFVDQHARPPAAQQKPNCAASPPGLTEPRTQEILRSLKQGGSDPEDGSAPSR